MISIRFLLERENRSFCVRYMSSDTLLEIKRVYVFLKRRFLGINIYFIVDILPRFVYNRQPSF